MSELCKRKIFLTWRFLGFVCLCMIIMTAAGCEPLRKKFTRKKKEQKQEDIIPLLEPLDYPSKALSVFEQYRHHYSLWQVWHKDLMTAIKYNESDKSINYMLGQLIVQIEELQKISGASLEEGLGDIKNELNNVVKEFAKPAGLRNRTLIENRLIRLDRKFRKNYSPRIIKDNFK